jgi:hypothetical protein
LLRQFGFQPRVRFHVVEPETFKPET